MTTLEIVLRAFANRPGAFSIAGSDFCQSYDIERTNSNDEAEHGEDVENTSPYMEAEVVPVVSDAIPVIVVDGVLEKWIDFGNHRVQVFVVILMLIFVAFIVAIGLLSNQKNLLVHEAECGNGAFSKGNTSRCDVDTGTSTMPSFRSNSETAVPSNMPTLSLSNQPTMPPKRKGWTLLHSGDMCQNIPTSHNCGRLGLISGNGSRGIIDCYDAGFDEVYLYVVELTLENGWVSVFSVEKEGFEFPSILSHDGATFAFYDFGVLRVYKQLNTSNGNTSRWRQHVIDNSEYRFLEREQTMSLSGDGNRLAILRLSAPNKTDVVIYDCVNDKNQTWIETDVIDTGYENFGVRISHDGSTVVALSEYIRRENSMLGNISVIIQVIKYNELESSWQRVEEVIKKSFQMGFLSISGDGNTIAFAEKNLAVTNIFQYNTSLSKYEWSMEVAEGSLPSLSGSGTRIAIAFLKKGEVRVYDILGNQLIPIVESIDPCNKVKSCNIRYLSLSHDGSKLTIEKHESDHENDDFHPFWLFVNTYEIQV